MRKKIAIACLFILLISVTLLSLQKTPVAALDIETITGDRITTQDLLGKVFLINFWATDCPGCINEMPGLIETYNKYKKQNFEVIAVSMFYDPPSRVISFAKKNNLPFPVALDMDKKIASQFNNIKLTPTSILIDHKGKIINTIIGEINFLEFNPLLEKVLSESISRS